MPLDIQALRRSQKYRAAQQREAEREAEAFLSDLPQLPDESEERDDEQQIDTDAAH